MTIRLLITDDHGMMRAGLRAILSHEPAIEVVGEAANGAEAIRLATELKPDIVLLDIGMPGMDGIETTRRLKQAVSAITVLILTVYEDESLLREAIRAGAAGYVTKRGAEEELIDAILAVARGDMYIHPAITHLLLKELNPTIHPEAEAIASLTPRELEVMSFVVRGYTNRQIAETLFISSRTVEGHRASLLGKLGLKNRVELVEFAEKYGLFGR
jgi:DNA-binding NarL/FixJ family response regulator